jgi:hypothetical protein
MNPTFRFFFDYWQAICFTQKQKRVLIIFGKWGITERSAMKGSEKGEGYVVKGRRLGINNRDFNNFRKGIL